MADEGRPKQRGKFTCRETPRQIHLEETILRVCKAEPIRHVGEAAPAFKLQDQTGEWRSLADYRGKWVVLYFYPKDGTPGCTTQACEIRDDIFAFRRANAAVLGVSVDSIDSKKGFAEENNLPFPVLADAEKQVTKAYGALTSYPQFKLFDIARRDTYIIDPQGRVARRFENVKAEGHSKMVLAELAALQKTTP